MPPVRAILLALLLAPAVFAATDEPLPRAPRSDAANPLAVHADFPGGSAELEAVDHGTRTITIAPADHPGRGWRCWWYLKVTGIRPGETLTLRVAGGRWAWPRRAAYSLDGGAWRQTTEGRRDGSHCVYRQRIDAPAAWFAWGPPYLPHHAETLIRKCAAKRPEAQRFVLCRTREDRPVPGLRISAPTPKAGAARPGIWIQARQHAWETGSSWVAQGLAEWLVSDESRAARLRRAADVVIVPIMDVDNVVRGAGGKGQQPRDHNRDWTVEPHWHSVKAAMEQIRSCDGAAFATSTASDEDRPGRLAVFIDLHNPGPGDRQPYFYVPPAEDISPRQRANLRRFLGAVGREMTGPLVFEGTARISGPAYDEKYRQMSKNWVARNTNRHVVAVTLETAWNTPYSTPDGYRAVGRQLGRAIARYLAQHRFDPLPPEETTEIAE
jgi:hypothetical protein